MFFKKYYPPIFSLLLLVGLPNFRTDITGAQTLPEPPQLLSPKNGAVITESHPAFFWTSALKVPGRQKFYKLTIVRLMPGQDPQKAIRGNKPHHQQTMRRTSYEYPKDGTPFVKGSDYAWQVQTIDEKGQSIATNDGYTEIFTFTLQGEEIPAYQPLLISTSTLTMTGLRPQPYSMDITTGTLTMTGLRTQPFVQNITTGTLTMTGLRSPPFLMNITTGTLTMTGLRIQPYSINITTGTLTMTGLRTQPFIQNITTGTLTMTGLRTEDEQEEAEDEKDDKKDKPKLLDKIMDKVKPVSTKKTPTEKKSARKKSGQEQEEKPENIEEEKPKEEEEQESEDKKEDEPTESEKDTTHARPLSPLKPETIQDKTRLPQIPKTIE